MPLDTVQFVEDFEGITVAEFFSDFLRKHFDAGFAGTAKVVRAKRTARISEGPSRPMKQHRTTGTAIVRKRSYISEDLSIEGDISGTGILEFHGEITGGLNVDALVVAKQGRVNGAIHVRNLTIQGQVTGTIFAQNVEIETSASVVADTAYERLSIESGAEVEGGFKSRKCEMPPGHQFRR